MQLKFIAIALVLQWRSTTYSPSPLSNFCWYKYSLNWSTVNSVAKPPYSRSAASISSGVICTPAGMCLTCFYLANAMRRRSISRMT